MPNRNLCFVHVFTSRASMKDPATIFIEVKVLELVEHSTADWVVVAYLVDKHLHAKSTVKHSEEVRIPVGT